MAQIERKKIGGLLRQSGGRVSVYQWPIIQRRMGDLLAPPQSLHPQLARWARLTCFGSLVLRSDRERALRKEPFIKARCGEATSRLLGVSQFGQAQGRFASAMGDQASNGPQAEQT